ncbi:SAV_6107 family HEPN domain-containing protein [Microbispora triticiradicis]|uniref:SAV_6107 family HEPN domain-containing protein n=1 Tax=Microbispora triticiradicis TaxID=2200763 RepID=UPI001AD63692|nr:SAV_6107 family HEPN domain-containing protein [Microbispora triticiradicis]MBO4272549.1 chromosome segregation protein SMC [Microbispora triticiradicis]
MTEENGDQRTGPRLPQAVLARLADARACLADATVGPTPADRYVAAHLAALRAAAGILAARPRPMDGRRRRLRSAWELLPEVEPKLADWAAYFAMSATKRAAVEAGMVRAVTQNDADEIIAEADRFVGEIESILGLPGRPTLPMAG